MIGSYMRPLRGDFICSECGWQTDIIDVVVESHGEEGYDSECPKCGEELERAIKCEECGRVIAACRAFDGLCIDCALVEAIDPDELEEAIVYA